MITGIALPPLKLPKAIENRSEINACPKTPTRYRKRRGSTTAATSPTGNATSSVNGNPDPFIWVESTNLNVHLLTMSPRKIIRRGSGGVGIGGGLAYSPRRQARTVGGNGILDAIEVVLTITSSGRTYQATRSLARIIELSTDLIADAMEDEDVAAIPILPDEVKLMSLGPPPSPSASMAARSGGGGGGGGLVHLQHRLDSVRNMLNVWFKRLLESVDAGSSVALSAFLWEPLWLKDSRPSSKGGGSGCSGTSSRSKCAAGGVPLAQSLSNDSTHSSSSSNAFGVTAPATNTSFHICNGSSGTLPPLAFGPNKSWKPARVRRGSADSISTLSSIDETLLF